MNSLFKNIEYKRIMAKLIIAQIIFSLILFLAMYMGLKSLSINLVDQNAGILGRLIESFPDREDEIGVLLMQEASTEHIESGKAILSRYGYTGKIQILLQPILGRLYPRLQLLIVGIASLFIVPLILIVHREYSHIFQKIQQVSFAAERVVQDDFSHTLPEDDESGFSILNHNFNQMANRVKLSIQSLEEDKLFLKDIISDISHQLKTPLSSLMMFNELMLKDEDMDPATRMTFLERSFSQLERMKWLTINLLKMARLESGSIQFKNRPTPLIRPIDIALNSLNNKIVEKDIDIKVTGDTQETVVLGDVDWLGEAFINIIKNSIEHTPFNGGVHIHLSHTPIFSQVEIEDTGEGIDREDLPHVFERFYRSSNSVKTESVGIGLSLSKVIIEGQNGSIWVESKKGRGTKFTITFLKGII